MRFPALIYVIPVILFISSCDSKQNKIKKWDDQFLCYSLAICTDPRGTRFGIIGDSWTDLAGGQPVVRTLRVQLEEDYHYKFTGATVGGNKIETENLAGKHFEIIEKAGTDLKYMLVSLGGNDLMYTGKFSDFLPDPVIELNRRMAIIENHLLEFVRSGNSYKENRWGGRPLVWIFHGYDYLNPDTPNLPDTIMCRSSLKSSGFTDVQIDSFHKLFIDKYNDMLHHAASLEPSIRVIDLRGTLGGPPFARTDLMVDCIHPNTAGFTAITGAYVPRLKAWTGEEH